MPIETCSRTKFSENNHGISLLDLPDSILEWILNCLSPREVCRLATLSTFLRDICRSESLWEKLMKQKWGKVIGNVAYQEWQKCMALKKRAKLMGKCNPFESFGSFHVDWPILTINGSTSSSSWPWSTSIPDDSVMALCISLETGRFWFPAQSYHKEVPNDRWKTTLRNITWDRVRAAVVDDSPYVFHMSDCLNDLMPGDHIEIQWRKSKRDPYDELIVEFNQYPHNSSLRRAVLYKRECKEQGNREDGFLWRSKEASERGDSNVEDDEFTYRWLISWWITVGVIYLGSCWWRVTFAEHL